MQRLQAFRCCRAVLTLQVRVSATASNLDTVLTRRMRIQNQNKCFGRRAEMRANLSRPHVVLLKQHFGPSRKMVLGLCSEWHRGLKIKRWPSYPSHAYAGAVLLYGKGATWSKRFSKLNTRGAMITKMKVFCCRSARLSCVLPERLLFTRATCTCCVQNISRRNGGGHWRGQPNPQTLIQLKTCGVTSKKSCFWGKTWKCRGMVECCRIILGCNTCS